MENLDQYIPALLLKNEESFETIYHETKTSVYAIILSIIKDRSLAEDVMQETYIKMIASIRQYKVGTNFRNWLLTIARNTALDYYRTRKKETLIDDIALDSIPSPVSHNAIDSMIAEELLSCLSQDEREVVLLRIVDTLKFKDIAVITTKPIGTVLWLYNQAIRKMRKYEGGVEYEKS